MVVTVYIAADEDDTMMMNSISDIMEHKCNLWVVCKYGNYILSVEKTVDLLNRPKLIFLSKMFNANLPQFF